MQVSVLLSSYNGEQYIEEQLSSIFSQTREPDQVVIVDDCSTDSTVEKIRTFIEKKNLSDKWEIHENTSNMGWRWNFIDGLKYVTGDVVFYSDQDDIWFDNKIAEYTKVLSNDSSINVLVSSETLWNSDSPKPRCCISKYHYDLIELSANNDDYLIRTSGCCMAIRMEYVNRMIHYCIRGWAHDDFFWKMGILDGSLAYITTSTILHRITGVNESRKKNTFSKALWSTKVDIQIANALIQRLDNEKIAKDNEKKIIIKHKLKGFVVKQSMLEKKSIFSALQLCFFYSDIYRRKRQIVGDYLRALHLL